MASQAEGNIQRRKMDVAELEQTLAETLVPWKDKLITSDRLTKQELIAEGGFGSVWKAELRDSGAPKSSTFQMVAVKKLRPTGEVQDHLALAIAFARELKVWAPIQHENLLPLLGYNLDKDAGTAYFVSPYESHGNISGYLGNPRTAATPAKRLELAIDTARGLAYLHDAKICHGDIKASNVIIGAQTRAMLCDFGLAKVLEELPSGLTTTRFSEARTLRYQSPELYHVVGARRTPESDVWAWGALLFEIMTGNMPYGDCTDVQVNAKLFHKDPPATAPELLPLSERLRTLLERCWSQDAKARPTMSECLESLLAERQALEVVEIAHPQFCGVRWCF